MMWSIANLKENINQMALDVHQDAADDELEICHLHRRSSTPGEDSSVSADRRSSHRFAQSKSPLRSPISNGIDSGYKPEIEKYKAEIQRLQASETEIKALSVNYAALLKEKEERISRLHEENGSLKKNLEATNASLHASKHETPRTLTSKRNVLKELADLLEEKNKSLVAIQANYDSEITQLRTELSKEREILANIQLKLNEEHNLNGSFQKELFDLKIEKDKNTSDMKELRNELNDKISEIRRLQLELTRRDNEEEENEMSESLKGAIAALEQENLKSTSEMKELQNELNYKILEIRRLQLELTRRDNEKEANETSESLKKAIATLEKENINLKMEKAELEVALKMNMKSPTDDPNPSNNQSSNSNEVHASIRFPEKEEMELSIQKLEKDLKEACQERDKALQELTRLKQHLLNKELEESDKMDEDSKIIKELRANCDYQRSQILYLEKALKQAIAGQEDFKKSNSNELQKSKEMINDLNQKLARCISTIDAKNIELMNLQTALGQYYAESEARERLEGDLALAREELAKFPELLKGANQRVEVSQREKDEILAKFSHAERMLSEGKQRVHKLEEDNLKLRRALEQSMTRLNRMSVDSDYFVDRRIVIKLLVTYFQRNHSKEVLDLMVRMLGFTEEDKQRIGMAQQGAGKGVVRGVLGLPGRLVGGILGGSSAEASGPVPSDNQSFADLWVDFLLKETEERERRELMEATASSKGNTDGNTSSTAETVPDYRTSSPASSSTSARGNPIVNYQSSTSSFFSRGNLQQHQPENSDAEFSTVPLTTPIHPSPENSSRISRFLPRY